MEIYGSIIEEIFINISETRENKIFSLHARKKNHLEDFKNVSITFIWLKDYIYLINKVKLWKIMDINFLIYFLLSILF